MSTITVEMNDAAYPSALPKPVGKLRGMQAMSATKPQEGMSMHRIRQNARQRLVMLAICAPIYLTPVDAQIDTPTANQRAAIQDLFKVSAAMDLCGYEMNARKVSSDLAQIDMTLRDVTAKGRFWSYVSAIWPSWWDELQKMKGLSPKEVLCSGWAADYGESAPTPDRRTWLQKAD